MHVPLSTKQYKLVPASGAAPASLIPVVAVVFICSLSDVLINEYLFILLTTEWPQSASSTVRSYLLDRRLELPLSSSLLIDYSPNCSSSFVGTTAARKRVCTAGVVRRKMPEQVTCDEINSANVTAVEVMWVKSDCRYRVVRYSSTRWVGLPQVVKCLKFLCVVHPLLWQCSNLAILQWKLY